MRKIALLSTALFALAAAPASGQSGEPVVYHSPNDPETGEPTIPRSLRYQAVEQLDIYIDAGDVPTTNGGIHCETKTADPPGGNGDELCGFDFTIAVTGGSQITDFTALIPNTVLSPIGAGTDELRVTAVTTSGAPLHGAVLVGTLEVTTGGTVKGYGTVTMAEAVDADLDLRVGSPRDIFVIPEPGLLPLLATGLIGLVVLHRLRGAAR